MSNVQVIKKDIKVEGRVLATVLVTLKHEDGTQDEGMTMPQLVKLTGEDKTRLHHLIKNHGWSLLKISDKHAPDLRKQGVISLEGRRPNFVPRDTVQMVLAKLVGDNPVADEINRQLWGVARAGERGDAETVQKLTGGPSLDLSAKIDSSVMQRFTDALREQELLTAQERARADTAEAKVEQKVAEIVNMKDYAADVAVEHGYSAKYIRNNTTNIKAATDEYYELKKGDPRFSKYGNNMNAWTSVYLNKVHFLFAGVQERTSGNLPRNLFNKACIERIEKKLGEKK